MLIVNKKKVFTLKFILVHQRNYGDIVFSNRVYFLITLLICISTKSSFSTRPEYKHWLDCTEDVRTSTYTYLYVQTYLSVNSKKNCRHNFNDRAQ